MNSNLENILFYMHGLPQGIAQKLAQADDYKGIEKLLGACEAFKNASSSKEVKTRRPQVFASLKALGLNPVEMAQVSLSPSFTF